MAEMYAGRSPEYRGLPAGLESSERLAQDPRPRSQTWISQQQQHQHPGTHYPYYPGPYSAPPTSLHFPPEQIQFDYRPPSPLSQAASLLAFQRDQQFPQEHYYQHNQTYPPFAGSHMHPYPSPILTDQRMYMIPESEHSQHISPRHPHDHEYESGLGQFHLLSPNSLVSPITRDGRSPVISERSSFSNHPENEHEQGESVENSGEPSTGNRSGTSSNYAALAREATFARRASANEVPQASGVVVEPPLSEEEADSPLATDAASMLMHAGEHLLSPAFMDNEGFKPTAQGTPFISKLLHLLSNDKYRDYIRWNKAGDSFILSHTNQYFAAQILPIFFRHSNCASFIRQLNLYQFTRLPIMQLLQNLDEEGTGNLGTTAPSSCFSGFSHPHFKRGQEDNFHLIKPKASAKNRDRAGSAVKKPKNPRQRSDSAAQVGPSRSAKSPRHAPVSPYEDHGHAQSPRNAHFHPYYQSGDHFNESSSFQPPLPPFPYGGVIPEGITSPSI